MDSIRIAVFVMLVSYVAGCTESPSGPLRAPSSPLLALSPCHSSLSGEQCERLNKAIAHLKKHDDPLCKTFGTNAYRRNTSMEYWYDPYDGTGNLAYSRGTAEDGEVWFTTLGWTHNTAGLSAHEEYHLMYPEDLGEDKALAWEAYCGTGF